LGRWDQEVCSFAIPLPPLLPHSLSPLLPGYDAYGAYLDNLHELGEGLLAGERESDGQESFTDMRKRARLCIEREGGHMDHRTGSF